MSLAAPESPLAPQPPASPSGADAWPAWVAPVGLVAGLIGAFVGGLIVVIVAQAFGVDATGDDTPPGVLLGATFVQDVAFVGAVIVFARMTGPVFAEHLGLRPTRLVRAVVGVLATYVGFLVLAGLWWLIVGTPDDEPLLDDLGVDESTVLLVLGLVTVCVLAPLVEEVFFRGFFFRALRNAMTVPMAAICTGVVFGLMHLLSSPIEAIVPLAILGALFCLLYQATGSIYPCIAAHAINNSVAFGVAEDWGWEIAPLIVGSLAACALVVWAATRTWPPAATAAA
ncbi:MAG TPA: CPBP family intramembrane glutamic endopeptidase [Solirubrobacteraceae bacterium]